MRITDKLFNEIETLTIGDLFNQEEFELVDDLAYEELDEDTIEEIKSDEDLQEVIDENVASIIHIHKVNRNGLLYQALIEWFEGSPHNILSHIRSGLYGDDGNLYFVSGVGYDIVDTDLLNGSGSGATKQQFLEFLNQSNQKVV